MACGDLRWIAGIHNVRVGSLKFRFLVHHHNIVKQQHNPQGITSPLNLVLYSINISPQLYLLSAISSRLEIEVDCISHLLNLQQIIR